MFILISSLRRLAGLTKNNNQNKFTVLPKYGFCPQNANAIKWKFFMLDCLGKCIFIMSRQVTFV